jgi:peroxiredoxin
MRPKVWTDPMRAVVRPVRHSLRLSFVFGIALLVATLPASAEELTAPDFALRSLDGRNLRLSEFRGEVVLLNFWAQWCGECRQAMPGLNELYSKYQRAGLVMLSISVDEDTRRVADLAKSLKLAFPVLIDERKEASSLYQLKTMPFLVLIDRDGRMHYTHAGYQRGDEQRWSEQVKRLLNE